MSSRPISCGLVVRLEYKEWFLLEKSFKGAFSQDRLEQDRDSLQCLVQVHSHNLCGNVFQ